MIAGLNFVCMFFLLQWKKRFLNINEIILSDKHAEEDFNEYTKSELIDDDDSENKW